jgi:hypothetical protein
MLDSFKSVESIGRTLPDVEPSRPTHVSRHSDYEVVGYAVALTTALPGKAAILIGLSLCVGA